MAETLAAKAIFVRVPEELHRALKVAAANEGVSLTALVERAVRVYLNAGG
jgi:predicted HicB family RNase H-like nuclease